MNDIEVLYVITETDTNKITYRIIQHSSGKIRDVGYDYIVKYNVSLANAKSITVRDMQKYSGRLLVGINDFETYCRLHDLQHLLSEYDTSKNPKGIQDITKGCIDKVWWKCSKCGHEWQAYIKARTSVQSGCPMCKHSEGKYHTFVENRNDLATWCKENNRLDILTEYSPKNKLKPNEISAKGHDKIIWVCPKCKNEYISILGNRTDKNQGCPNCSRSGTSFPERFIFEFLSDCIEDVKYRYKISGIEIDIYLPSINLAIDYRGKYWHKDRQDIDEYKESLIHNMGIDQLIVIGDRQGSNLIVDNNHIVFDEKDYCWLAKILVLRCKIDSKYLTVDNINEVIRAVTNKQNNKEVVNSLAETHPEVAARWDYELNGDFKPTNITYGTKYKAWFKCKTCGKSYYSYIRKQAIGQGCPYCYKEGRRVNAEIRLQEKSLPKERQYGDWTIIAKAGDRKYLCKCVCGSTKILSASNLWHIKKKGYKCKHATVTQVIPENNPSVPKVSEQQQIEQKPIAIEQKPINKVGIDTVSKLNETKDNFFTDMKNISKDLAGHKISDSKIYIPEKKLCIEYVDTSQRVDKKYRQQQTIQYAKSGTQLVTIFDYEWNMPERKDKLANYIKYLVTDRIICYARNMNVQKIESSEAVRFLDKYHLQGGVKSEYNIALYDNNEIISVLTFRSPRFDHSYEWEVTRYCTKDGVGIVGGAERLFKHFVDEVEPSSIMTYIDISKFTGNVYTRLGFKPTKDFITVPNYVWVNKEFNVLPRYKTQKHKLLSKGLGTSDQTEDEIMTSIGYTKVYDSGNLKLEWLKH